MKFYIDFYLTQRNLKLTLQNLMKHYFKNMLNLIHSCLFIIHDILKKFVLYTTALVLEFSTWILDLYSSLEIFLVSYTTLFVNYSFLKLLSLLNFINQLYSDIFSFEHRMLKTCFLLIFVATVVIGNALNYNRLLTEKIFWYFFIVCYMYITILIFSIIILILVHFKDISCAIWYIFLKDYRDSLGYKVLTFVIFIYLFRYYFVNNSTKRHYIECFLILLFGWFTQYLIYQNFNITSPSKIDPCIDLFISLGLNWLLYEFLYFFIDKTDPEVTRTYQKWNQWLDSLASNSFIDKMIDKIPLKWFLFTYFCIIYILFILMGLI